MNINKTILKWGLFINGIVVIFCVIFSIYCELEEPVFLEHYYEYGIPVSADTESSLESMDTVEFTLHYITNRNSNNKVTSIHFKEYPDVTFYASENTADWYDYHMHSFNLNITQAENYGRYSIHTVFVTMDNKSLVNQEEGIHLSQAMVTFSNGDVVETNIGSINFYKDEQYSGLLNNLKSCGSMDGSEVSSYAVEKDITIMGIKSSLMEELNKFFELKVGDAPYTNISGVQYKAGDIFNISSKMNNLKDIDFTIVDINPILYYKDQNNITYSQSIYQMSSIWNNLDFKHIFKYLNAKGELKW